MSFTLLLIWAGLAFLGGGAVFLLAERIGMRRRPTWAAGLLAAAAVLILLSILLRTSSEPRPVHLQILRPPNGLTIEGHKLRIEGTANPAGALVTVVIRAETAEGWWVQDLVRPDPVSGRWSIEGFLGTPAEGGGENYSLVALASAEDPFTRFLLGRRLRAGMVVRTIPLWNQSEPVVVRRRS